MPIFVTEQLGPTRHLTPEGYLLCVGVPIARIGSQIYTAAELPTLEGGRDGLITVHREEAEVFRPETIASFEGKSVTVFHQFVDPTNVKRVEVGHAQNIRRSEVERDLLIADLLIKDERAIDLVTVDPTKPNKKVLREISCGYDAEYVQVEPGIAYQRNIIGNHVALVERGRAGPRCSIQDEEPEIMPTAKKPNAVSELFTKLVRACRTGDAALIKKTADEAEAVAEEEEKRVADEEREAAEAEEKQKTADQIAALAKTVDTLAGVVAKLAKGKTADSDEELDENGQPKAKTGDEETEEEKEKRIADEAAAAEEEKTKTADALRDTASRAEILVPGFTMPTADSVPNLAGVATVQRKVLADALKTEDGRAIVTPLLAGRTVDAMPVDAVATVFVAASEMAKQKNNSRGARQGMKTKDFGSVVTAAEINRRNAEFYSQQN